MKKLNFFIGLIGIFSIFSLPGLAKDEDKKKDLLQEDELDKLIKAEDKVRRSCSSEQVQLEITGSKIKISDSSGKFGKFKEYSIYEESGSFILADQTSLSSAKFNLVPEIVLVKSGQSAYLLEGHSFKFQKDTKNENCQISSKTNFHCYSRKYKANLSMLKNKIEYIDQKYKTLKFNKININGSPSGIHIGQSKERAIAIIDSRKIKNAVTSNPGTALKFFKTCSLTLPQI